MMSIDFFDDSGLIFQEDSDFLYEFFVTPQPPLFSNMSFGPNNAYLNRGPIAANDNVLFKRLCYKVGTGANSQVVAEDFPNQTLGALPTFNWYAPTLYLTLIIHPNSSAFTIDVDGVALSVYMTVKSQNADSVEFGMGVYREYNHAYIENLMSNGYQIPKASNAYRSFPFWFVGGIRPEYMLRADALADYWLGNFNQDAEKMIDQQNVLTYQRRAATMQRWDEAFGDVDPAKGAIPEWIHFIENMHFGQYLLRDDFPPKRKLSNGNTEMFA